MPEVLLPQDGCCRLRMRKKVVGDKVYRLLGHCTGRPNPGQRQQWQQVFETPGLGFKPESTGCCGMSGTLATRHATWRPPR